MNVVMLRKGNATYACDTEERLKRFKAAGWVEDSPPAQPAGDGAKQPKRQSKKKTTEKAE